MFHMLPPACVERMHVSMLGTYYRHVMPVEAVCEHVLDVPADVGVDEWAVPWPVEECFWWAPSGREFMFVHEGDRHEAGVFAATPAALRERLVRDCPAEVHAGPVFPCGVDAAEVKQSPMVRELTFDLDPPRNAAAGTGPVLEAARDLYRVVRALVPDAPVYAAWSGGRSVHLHVKGPCMLWDKATRAAFVDLLLEGGADGLRLAPATCKMLDRNVTTVLRHNVRLPYSVRANGRMCLPVADLFAEDPLPEGVTLMSLFERDIESHKDMLDAYPLAPM